MKPRPRVRIPVRNINPLLPGHDLLATAKTESKRIIDHAAPDPSVDALTFVTSRRSFSRLREDSRRGLWLWPNRLLMLMLMLNQHRPGRNRAINTIAPTIVITRKLYPPTNRAQS